MGRVRRFDGALEDYLHALQERFAGLDLSGRRILLDCANGATYRAAPEIFRRLGADVGVLADAPNGVNINDRCGSTHLARLKAAMQAGDEHAGFAFACECGRRGCGETVQLTLEEFDAAPQVLAHA